MFELARSTVFPFHTVHSLADIIATSYVRLKEIASTKELYQKTIRLKGDNVKGKFFFVIFMNFTFNCINYC